MLRIKSIKTVEIDNKTIEKLDEVSDELYSLYHDCVNDCIEKLWLNDTEVSIEEIYDISMRLGSLAHDKITLDCDED